MNLPRTILDWKRFNFGLLWQWRINRFLRMIGVKKCK